MKRPRRREVVIESPYYNSSPRPRHPGAERRRKGGLLTSRSHSVAPEGCGRHAAGLQFVADARGQDGSLASPIVPSFAENREPRPEVGFCCQAVTLSSRSTE